MASYSEALKELQAGNRPLEMQYDCLEIRHPDMTEPIRIVQGFNDVVVRHEKDAPLNPNELCRYIGAPWSMKLPDVAENTMPEIQLNFDNVSREITQYLELAATQNQPLKVIYRVYTSSTLEVSPQIDPPIEMEISEATANNYSVTTTANLENVFSAVFPYERYTPQRFPALTYAT